MPSPLPTIATVNGFISAVTAAIHADASLAAAVENAFGLPLLTCAGSWWGNQNELGIDKAPFVSVTHSDDEAALELFRLDRPFPRAFQLRVISGFPMLSDPPPPIPDAAGRAAPVLYAAGHGSAGEKIHMAALRIVTQTANADGIFATAAGCIYSGSARFPLETFDTTVTFERARLVSKGAF